MSRLSAVLLALLLVALPLSVSTASAAPVRAAQADVPADEPAGVPADDESADPADEPLDLTELCDLSSTEDDRADAASDEDGHPMDEFAPDEADAVDLVEGNVDPFVDEEVVDDSSEDDGPTLDELCAEDPADEAADGGSDTTTTRELLKSGVVQTGTVSVSGAGTITQELFLPASSSKRSIRAARHPAKARKAVKKARRANDGRVLAGRVSRSVTKAGVVHLSVRLNVAARKALRGAKREVRFTVKTQTKLRGSRPRTTIGTIVAQQRSKV